MTSGYLTRLTRKLALIVRFPFQLGRQLQTLENKVADLQHQHNHLALAQQQHYQQLQHIHAQLQRDYVQLQQDYAQLRRDHNANILWLQGMYPDLVSAIAKKLEQEHFDKLTQDVFAALHREAGVLADRLGALEDARIPASHHALEREDSRSAGFYLELERRFRGTAQEIAARAQPYIELLQADPVLNCPVLDIGSGRGEWLALLGGLNLPATGVDLNPINGDYCRSRGLNVLTGDALAHLASLPANSLGTVTAFHLVEHLPFSTLLALTDHILRVLKPGGLVIYETPNPENLLVATQSFWLDPTHLRPLPPDLLYFLLLQRGFASAEIRRLHPGEPSSTSDATLQALLSGPRDYAVLARKTINLQAQSVQARRATSTTFLPSTRPSTLSARRLSGNT